MSQEELYIEEYTTFMVYVLTGLSGSVLILGFVALLFTPLNDINFIAIIVISLSCLLIFGLLKLLKSFIDFVHKKFEVEELIRYRTIALIGYGGITLCTIIPRVWVYFIGRNYPVFSFYMAIPVVAIITLNYLFIWEHIDIWKKIISNNEKFIHTILAINLISGIVAWGIRDLFYTDKQEIEQISICQVVFAVICAPSSVEFGITLIGGFRLNDRTQNNQNMQLEFVKVQTFSPPQKIPQEERYLGPCTSIWLIMTAPYAGTLNIVAILFLLDTQNNINYFLIGGILSSCLLIFGTLKLLKTFVENIEMEKLKRYKTFALIGFGGITLCTIIPRVCVYFIVQNIPIFCYCIILPSFAIITLNYLFIKEQEFDWKLISNDKLIYNILIINLIIFIVSVRLLVFFYTDEREIGQIGACLVVFALVCVTSSVEFGIILNGGFRLKDRTRKNQDEQLETEEVQSEEESESSLSGLKCKRCTMEYNKTSRIPRILKKCRHTICEHCAHNLLNWNYRNVIICPVCERPTYVKGSVKLLPRNYITLEMIRG